eukprot:Sspe_Gene.89955::Locus_61606_Transcript_2_2_Confidence_0.667_Length_1362::g.89955::m.89955
MENHPQASPGTPQPCASPPLPFQWNKGEAVRHTQVPSAAPTGCHKPVLPYGGTPPRRSRSVLEETSITLNEVESIENILRGSLHRLDLAKSSRPSKGKTDLEATVEMILADRARIESERDALKNAAMQSKAELQRAQSALSSALDALAQAEYFSRPKPLSATAKGVASPRRERHLSPQPVHRHPSPLPSSRPSRRSHSTGASTSRDRHSRVPSVSPPPRIPVRGRSPAQAKPLPANPLPAKPRTNASRPALGRVDGNKPFRAAKLGKPDAAPHHITVKDLPVAHRSVTANSNEEVVVKGASAAPMVVVSSATALKAEVPPCRKPTVSSKAKQKTYQPYRKQLVGKSRLRSLSDGTGAPILPF